MLYNNEVDELGFFFSASEACASHMTDCNTDLFVNGHKSPRSGRRGRNDIYQGGKGPCRAERSAFQVKENACAKVADIGKGLSGRKRSIKENNERCRPKPLGT